MSKINTFKTIDTYNSRILANYQQQLKQQQRLLKLIKRVLPEHLAEHISYCAISNQKLLIYTDSSVWSAQLRFYQQAMLETVVETNTAIIEEVKIRIIAQNNPPKNERELNMPSADNIKLLHDCGESIGDEKLKQALLRLSKTLDKLSS
ncbi:MAG: DUF721 domain-containing protein [Methylococcaceae bacterium]|nr:DUF721 domain-containing protein [Methylococcaceae bacterium]